MYIVALKMLELFGDLEVAELAAPKSPSVDGVLLRLTLEDGDRSAYSLEDQDAADLAKARLNGVIVEAGLEVDSYISPRYTLPLAQATIDSSALPRKTADIARYLLMDDRATEEVEKRYTAAIKWLRDLSMSRASLGGEDSVAGEPGRVIRRQGISGTDWGSY